MPQIRPFDILIERELSSPFCPIQAMLSFCKSRGHQPGPLFCHPDMSPITVSQFNTELHRCLTFCGLDTSRYKGHSFRIGAACHAADKGFSDAQIRALGRWKSDAFKVYIRSDTLQCKLTTFLRGLVPSGLTPGFVVSLWLTVVCSMWRVR